MRGTFSVWALLVPAALFSLSTRVGAGESGEVGEEEAVLSGSPPEVKYRLVPVSQALARFRAALHQPDVCSHNPLIKASCQACALLELTPDRKSCCADVTVFTLCHEGLGEILAGILGEEGKEEEGRNEDREDEEEYPGPEKRYGSVFSRWTWNRHNNRKYKRYGALFGRLMSESKPWWKNSG